MKVLIIAFADSIHTARWINQIDNPNYEIYLFPNHNNQKILSTFNTNVKIVKANIFKYLQYYLLKSINQIIHNKKYKDVNEHLYNVFRANLIHQFIQQKKPDIIHSLEFQNSCYLTLFTKQKYYQNKLFPKWIATNWGSDIYLFGRLKKHQDIIRQVLAECDYYSCECHRDIKLAQNFGFQGQFLPVFPNTGGFELELISKLRQQGSTSQRKIIMLKGYQTWAGRALFGLRALERCADILQGYHIYVYSARTEDIQIAIELFAHSTKISITAIPLSSSHQKLLELHGKARISIGLSISDGISTSLLEAMVMGSFPIQSWTACANEWLVDGETGLLVPPEDIEVIESAIRKALEDDQLVDSAAQRNYELAKIRLDSKALKQRTIQFYQTVFEDQ
ncbi:glycosyltransferase family 4 protein [Pseudanabaena biceps]|nr:glycosyltransferase family 4 protein [Pseudanabaena biceps]